MHTETGDLSLSQPFLDVFDPLPEYRSSFLFPIRFDFRDSDFRTFPMTPPELISGASIFFVPDDMPGPSKNIFAFL